MTGCVDLDLNFIPSTTLLPVRRLGLAIGQSAEVQAAWLRFPGFTLVPILACPGGQALLGIGDNRARHLDVSIF